MRATDRQAAGARVRRSNSRAARPASAIKTARKLSEIPPGEEVPLPDSPPGAVGSPGAPGEGRGCEAWASAGTDPPWVEGLSAVPGRSERPRTLG
jgi:hypothetical protein